MIVRDIQHLIGQPEGLTVEYKSAKGGIPQSLCPVITDYFVQPEYTELVLDLEKLEASKTTSEGLVEKLGERLGEKLGENRLRILSLIVNDPNITYAQIAEALSISTITIEKRIAEMFGVVIQHVGPDKGGYWEIIKLNNTTCIS